MSPKKKIKKDKPCSAISISLRPKSACLMFLIQKSPLPLEFFCCLSRGDVSSSELSVYDAAKKKKQTHTQTLSAHRPQKGTILQYIKKKPYCNLSKSKPLEAFFFLCRALMFQRAAQTQSAFSFCAFLNPAILLCKATDSAQH